MILSLFVGFAIPSTCVVHLLKYAEPFPGYICRTWKIHQGGQDGAKVLSKSRCDNTGIVLVAIFTHKSVKGFSQPDTQTVSKVSKGFPQLLKYFFSEKLIVNHRETYQNIGKRIRCIEYG